MSRRKWHVWYCLSSALPGSVSVVAAVTPAVVAAAADVDFTEEGASIEEEEVTDKVVNLASRDFDEVGVINAAATAAIAADVKPLFSVPRPPCSLIGLVCHVSTCWIRRVRSKIVSVAFGSTASMSRRR